MVEGEAAPLEDPSHVHVDGEHGPAEGEAGKGVGRVAAYAGELGEILGPAPIGHAAGGAVQAEGPPVVAEALPGPDRLGRSGLRQRLRCRPAAHPGEVAGHHPAHLGLLEHQLGDEDGVGVAGTPPGEVAAVLGEPGEEGLLHAVRARRLARLKRAWRTQFTAHTTTVAHAPAARVSMVKPGTIQLVR